MCLPDMYGVTADDPEEPVTDQIDQHVDALLARSAPRVSTASPPVQEAVRVLVRATAAAATTDTSADQGRHRRAGRRLVIGAGAAAVACAGVSAAAASPSAPAWLAWADWTPDATVVEPPGTCDVLGIEVVPDGAGPDDPGVVAARRYLADLEKEDVDYSQELIEQQKSVVTLEDGTQVLGEDFHSDGHMEFFAFQSAVMQMVVDEVERQGLSAAHVSLEGRADGCEPETPR